MIKKGWEFIKENVAAIITVITALLTGVYAVLRLCIYVYWNGYFTKLNMDKSIMNINFDNTIFSVIFVAIILFAVLFFVVWAYETIINIMKKERERQRKGVKKVICKIRALFMALLLSFIILFIINIPLIMLLAPLTQTEITIADMLALFILLYVLEMLLIVMEMMTKKMRKKKEKITEGEVALKIIEVFTVIVVILAGIFYGGTQAIDKKSSVQLVDNEEYMISYCDGEHYILHKVKYDEKKITIYRNEQKIVDIEGYEYCVRPIEEMNIED